MKNTLQEKLSLEQFPLSAKYDIEWVYQNEMGPSSLWLAEFLSEKMNLTPGMKVLDLGCGKAISSIFLAKEFDLQISAVDLWIPAEENEKRICAQNLTGNVIPIHAESHNLPFEREAFDAIVSMDSYHYYGTDEMYLEYLMDYLKPGGQLGIVVPSVYEEFNHTIPKRLSPYWEPYLFTHHSPQWWKSLWEHWDNIVTVQTADYMPNGYRNWLLWDKTLKEAGMLGRNGDVAMLEADGGNFTFCRVVARKNPE